MKQVAESRVIAVVDDNGLVLRSTGRLLASLGHRVILFDDPEIAAENLPLEHVDALILDFQMPRMSGVALARRVAERRGAAAPPMLLVTGALEKLQPADCALFTSIHAKPLPIDALEIALKHAFRGCLNVPSARTQEASAPGEDQEARAG